MPHLRIRSATTADLDALVELEFSAFSGDRISQRSWRDLLTSHAATVIVAEQAGVVIGSAVLLANARTSVVRLYSLAVAAEARRQGIAGRLLEEALHRSRQTGASLFRLETRLDNLGAQRLFERAGFVPFERVDGYYEDGAQAIRYQRALASIAAQAS